MTYESVSILLYSSSSRKNTLLAEEYVIVTLTDSTSNYERSFYSIFTIGNRLILAELAQGSME